MRILFIFCDMMRANLLNTFNPNVKDGAMDAWFKKMGGTAYTNCYTVGVDTPRGLTSMFTGLYPKHHGCSIRSRWARDFMYDVFTIFDLFQKHNYPMLFQINKYFYEFGELPNKEYKNLKLTFTLEDALRDIKANEDKKDLFAFIDLEDYHWAMDDYAHTSMGEHHGQRHLSNAFDMIFNVINKDDFDHIFIFSDHGCKLADELKKGDNIEFLTDDRTKIIMLVHKKCENEIKTNDKLCSIIDMLPTVNQLLKNNYDKFDGIPLFDKKEHENIVMEDQLTIKPDINSINEIWAVRTKNYYYVETLNESRLMKAETEHIYKKIDNPDEKIIKPLQKIIGEKAVSYTETKKLNEVLKGYRRLIDTNFRGKGVEAKYSDGENRVTNVEFKRKHFKTAVKAIGNPRKMAKIASGMVTLVKRKIGKDKYKRW